ncbi:hypothetical protein EU404_20390 [Salmonella enterica subsp. enterica serovar Weltevreden]|nr:hypothetical protein [Salmonella enterica subsp. enterica serovar Weltevreden]
MTIELQLSVNTMIMGSVGSSVHLYKYTGAVAYYTWSMDTQKVNRLLGFGSVGRRILAEDIAKWLSIDFTTAGELIKQAKVELPN